MSYEMDVYANRYEVIRKLGKGTNGVAYLVKDTGLPPTDHTPHSAPSYKTLKVINIEGIEAFEALDVVQEARLLSRLKHPYILRFFDSFVEKDFFCIVTEYCNGGDLSGHLLELKKSGKLMEEEQVAKWFIQLILATAYMHDKRVLHRDLKSSNIFINDGSIKVGDFGISRFLNSTIDMASTFVGTPYYMSPEVLKHEGYNSKSDMWSLGVILYEMCTQKRAFEGTNLMRVMWEVVEGVCPRLPNKFSNGLQEVLNSLLTKDPNSRASAPDLLRHPYIESRMQCLLKRLSTPPPEERTSQATLATSVSSMGQESAIPLEDTLAQKDKTYQLDPQWGLTLTPEKATGVEELTPREKLRRKKQLEADERARKMRLAAEDVAYRKVIARKRREQTFIKSEVFGCSSPIEDLDCGEEMELNALRQLCSPQGGSPPSSIKPLNEFTAAPVPSLETTFRFLKERSADDSGLGLSFDLRSRASFPDEAVVAGTGVGTAGDVTKYTSPRHPTDGKEIEDQGYTINNRLTKHFVTREDDYTSDHHHSYSVNKAYSKFTGNYQPVTKTATRRVDPDNFDERPIHPLADSALYNIVDVEHIMQKGPCHDTDFKAPYFSDFINSPVDEELASSSSITVVSSDCDPMPSHDESTTGNVRERASDVHEMVKCMEATLNNPSASAVGAKEFSSNSFGRTARQRTIENMRRQCIEQLGAAGFAEAYAYLHRRRVLEGNSAGEVTILSGLRILCPDVNTGFLLDQLIFLENGRVIDTV